MQSSTTSFHRGALLLSGVAAIALCYYSWSQYSVRSQSQSGAKLHRSNATHGRRRQRLRHTSQSPRANHDPLTRAIEQLAEAEESGQGFGLFDDREYITDDVLERHGDDFTLLPSNLEHIRETILSELQFPAERREELDNKILALFLDNFIRAGFPTGYYIAGDTDALEQALAPTINPTAFRNFMNTRYPLEAGFVEGSRQDLSEAAVPLPSVENVTQALSGDENARHSHPQGQLGDATVQGEGHQVLDLLYRIGEEQAKRSGYQHQGVRCNGCGMQPITGIRYHCANCWDYDLCEMCEALQIHVKTHVFYKIRIPAPTRGQIKLVQPKWYPGEPNSCPESIPGKLRDQLLDCTNLDRQELDAFYDQFRCIAGRSIANDPDGIGMAIDRSGFDRYFTSTTADRAPTPNLIYDRIFAFYDADGDDLINFAEYAKGMAELAYNKSREARIQRLFKAFDMNRDGFVERRDFLQLLQAHYSLTKEIAQEMIFLRWDGLTDEEIQDVIHGNNPISAAFGGSTFAEHLSRHGEGKHIDPYGDLVYDDDYSQVLKDDSQMLGNRAQAIARQACDTWPLSQAREYASEHRLRDEPVMAGYVDLTNSSILHGLTPNGQQGVAGQGIEDVDRLGQIHEDIWPDSDIREADVAEALGTNLSIDEIMDPIDRLRVLHARQARRLHDAEVQNLETERAAVGERWRRRQFYLDEEQGLRRPTAYHESDSSADEVEEDMAFEAKQFSNGMSSQQQLSARSRSSSKVRFDDSAIQSELETKSDISSRNTPLNERWGGVEFSQANRDAGIEIIYEAVQEAFNDMLSHFFKEQEDRCMSAQATRAERVRYKTELDGYERNLVLAEQQREQAFIDADMERTKALLNPSQGGIADGPVQGDVSSAMDESKTQRSEDVYTADAPTTTSETPDPTLPQNRPNEEGLFAFTISRDIDSDQPSVTPQLLSMWHQHNLIDREAEARNGYGRLNIDEFKRKLQDKDTNDIDIGAEGDDGRGYWEAKADLGRWSFLSSWIEMGSF